MPSKNQSKRCRNQKFNCKFAVADRYAETRSWGEAGGSVTYIIEKRLLFAFS